MHSSAQRLGRPKDVKGTDLRCLAAAEGLFAERGFEGTSLRDVAAAVGITSAAVIHHFGTKEQLYGLVLQRLVKSLDDYIPSAPEPTSLAAVVQMFERFLDWSFERQHFARLLMRELLENQIRISRARRMHLTLLITGYVDQIRRGQELGMFRDFDAELFVFYTLGAITHFSAAAPTIDRMLSDDRGDAISRFRLTLRESIMTMLVERPKKPNGGARKAGRSDRSRG